MTMYAVFDINGVMIKGVDKSVMETLKALGISPSKEKKYQTRKELFRQEGLDYEAFLREVWRGEHSVNIKPAEGAVECVKRLKGLGVNISAVSSMTTSLYLAKETLKKYGFPIEEFHGVGHLNSKWDAIQRPGFTVFVDNEKENIDYILEEMEVRSDYQSGRIKLVLCNLEGEEQCMEQCPNVVDIARSWEDIDNIIQRFGEGVGFLQPL
ncbi:MAG: hypothetical protein OXU73_01880 [Candidatus Campbellbacteria bacterium]|nr:hypothetical protein [Candidatus Campbellbacteria bacterium]